jgi:hypothetical protein
MYGQRCVYPAPTDTGEDPGDTRIVVPRSDEDLAEELTWQSSDGCDVCLCLEQGAFEDGLLFMQDRDIVLMLCDEVSESLLSLSDAILEG